MAAHDDAEFETFDQDNDARRRIRSHYRTLIQDLQGRYHNALGGQTGHGKSATGNSILGKNAFVSMSSPGSVTDDIKRVAERNGRRIEIVDSPGFADTSKGTDFVQKKRMQAVFQTIPGFNAIVFVLNPDSRFTDDLVKTVNLFFAFFGEGVDKFSFILFTHKKSKERMNEYINKACANPTGNVQVLLDLIERCGSKVMYIDNDRKDEKKQVVVDEIIRSIDKNIEREGKEYFTNDMFQRAMKEADRYIKEHSPTTPFERDYASDMVEMRIKTKPDHNETETDKNDEDFAKKHRTSIGRETFEERRRFFEFESSSMQTNKFQIHSEGTHRLSHQRVNATQHNHIHKPACIIVGQHERDPEKNNISGKFSKPVIQSLCSDEYHKETNNAFHDGMKHVDFDQQSARGSDEYRPAPSRKYDGFKDKINNDEKFFETLFTDWIKWLNTRLKTALNKLFP